MNFDENKLDNELKIIDPKTKEGLEKINQAKLKLPIHYDNLMNNIGGVITDTYDLDRLPSNIRKMVDIFEIETPALGLQTNIMVASMAYTNLFGKFRPYIRNSMVSRKTDIPTNVFAMIYAGSGLGKDASFNLGLDILKKSDDLIMERIAIDAENKAKLKAISKNNKKQEKAKVPKDKIVEDTNGWETFYSSPHNGHIKMATYEGLLDAAEIQIKSGDYGNLFLGISELGNSLKLDPNIDRALMVVSEMYDTGNVAEDLKKTKELKTGAIEGLGLSMLAHTSPAPLVRNPKVSEQINNLEGSYLGRRSFHLFSTDNEFVNNVEIWDDLDDQARNMQESTHVSVNAINKLETIAISSTQRILDGTDLNKLTLTEEAELLYYKYLLLNKWYRMLSYFKDTEFLYEGLLPELINRHWKAVKLAGIWALAQNTSVIDKDILSSAIYFTEFVGGGLRRLMYTINLETHERFVKAIEEGDILESIRFDQLIKQNYVKKADKNQIGALLTAINSALQGKTVVTADYKKATLNITQIKESEDNYGFSYLQFTKGTSKEDRLDKAYKGFTYHKTELLNLTKLLNQDCAYSPFKFKDGYRKDDNVESTTNYVVLDVDKSDLDMELLHETYLSGTLHIIATTSNPNNKHKFRVLIPIKQELGENNVIYKYVIQRIANELMLDIDLLGRSQVMFAYSNSTVLHNIDTKLKPMDISNYIKDSATAVQAKNYTNTLTKAQKAKAQSDMANDFETQFNFAINAPHGQGSVKLFGAGMKMKQAGCTPREIEIYLNKINSMWSSPMPHNRMSKIINQFNEE